VCGEREIWAYESSILKRTCWDCHRKLGHPETEEMKRHREINEKYQSGSVAAFIIATPQTGETDSK